MPRPRTEATAPPSKPADALGSTDIKVTTAYELTCLFCAQTFVLFSELVVTSTPVECPHCHAKGNVLQTRYEHSVMWYPRDEGGEG